MRRAARAGLFCSEELAPVPGFSYEILIYIHFKVFNMICNLRHCYISLFVSGIQYSLNLGINLIQIVKQHSDDGAYKKKHGNIQVHGFDCQYRIGTLCRSTALVSNPMPERTPADTAGGRLGHLSPGSR